MGKLVNNKQMIVMACPDQGAGSDPETLGLAFHHQGPTEALGVSISPPRPYIHTDPETLGLAFHHQGPTEALGVSISPPRPYIHTDPETLGLAFHH